MPEVILTPHVAAMTTDYPDAVADLVATNVGRRREGRAPINRVA
jgi:phosphoglycerate dehydrogenase-like enzyme